jgi:hypothetical protein
MRDLSFLTTTHPARDEPGLSTADERLAKISALADAGQFPEAAAAVDALIAQGILDIRLVVFVLHAALLEDGLPALHVALRDLPAFLRDNEAAIGPALRRPAQIAKSLRWLLEHAADHLEYHEAKRSPAWSRLQATMTAALCRDTVAALQAMLTAAGEPSIEATTEAAARLSRWLRDAAERLEGERIMAETDDDATPAAPTPTPAASAERPAPPAAEARLYGSRRLRELIEKLEAFESLIEKSRYERAAVVGDDVLRALESFDPREYFPELFSEFGALMASHVDDLNPHWDSRGSIRWRMLEQFYKVDLSRFVAES